MLHRPSGIADGERGATLVRSTLVLALVAGLAGVGLFAVTTSVQRSRVDACVDERGVVAAAIEATRRANPRQEYPAVGPSDDGLDRVREAGFLPYGHQSAYWRYADAPRPGEPEGLGGDRLVRRRAGEVPTDRCGA